MTISRSKFFLSTLFLPFLFFLGACNGGDKKAADTNATSATDTNTMDAVEKMAGEPAAINAISFRKYKLSRQTMEDLEKNPKNAKKLILKIELDNLKSPSTMKLFGYPAKNAAQGGENEPGTEILPDGNPISFDSPENIRIGNNEIVFKDFKENNQWAQFDYILLTPVRRINPTGSYDLVFSISYHDDTKALTMLTLPQETNPSPPKKPGD